MSTLTLSAICRLRVETGVAFATDFLVAIVLHGQSMKRWFDHHLEGLV